MKNRLLTIFIAIVLIASSALLTIFLLRENATNEYDVVFFGDSIVAGYHEESALASVLGKKSNLKVLNAGFGGMSMAKMIKHPYAGDFNDFYTMAGLSEAVKENDFSLQIMASGKDNPAMVDYFYDVAKDLSEVDFSSVSFVLIEHGANDYLDGITIENPEDRFDVYTYAGALRSSIENIMEGAPNAQIVICTPIYSYVDGMSGDCNEADFGGGYLRDYVEKELEIAKEYGIYVIDNFHEVEINKDNYKEYLHQGLHPYDSGVELITDNMIRHLEALK